MIKGEDEYQESDWSDALNMLAVLAIFILAGVILVGLITLIRWLMHLII